MFTLAFSWSIFAYGFIFQQDFSLLHRPFQVNFVIRHSASFQFTFHTHDLIIDH